MNKIRTLTQEKNIFYNEIRKTFRYLKEQLQHV